MCAMALFSLLGLVVACRSAAGSAASNPLLVGTSWRVVEIEGRGVLEGVESMLSFESARRIAGQAACNRYFGDLDIGEGRIRFRPMGTTRIQCPPDVMDQERRFLSALGAATSFRREGGELVLLDDAGRVLARLAPGGPGRTGAAPPSGPDAAPSAPPLAARVIECDDGRSFILARVDGTTAERDAIDLVVSDRRHRPPRVRTASGERYAAAGVSVRNKGGEAILTSTAASPGAQRTVGGRSWKMLERAAWSFARPATSPAGSWSSS